MASWTGGWQEGALGARLPRVPKSSQCSQAWHSHSSTFPRARCRRFECYQCSSARTATAQRVSIEPDAPSYILRAAGLEPQTSEETLYYLFAPVAPGEHCRL